MRRGVPLRPTVAVVVTLGGAAFALAAAKGLGDGAVYYYTPSEATKETAGEVIRVGGTVEPDSVRFDSSVGVLRFSLADARSTLPVVNSGAPPDLFTEGQEALIEGRMAGGVLRSSEVIVKHDEEYAAKEQESAGESP